MRGTKQSYKSMHKLLQHFKELTIRPKNAKKLKGLILQLAIQGKLTANWREQNQDIEPASELLKRIQKEKELLIKGKKIKKEKVLSPITKDEIPHKLASCWSWSRLGNYVHYGALSKYENKDASKDTWVLELEDIEKGSSKLLNKVRFSKRDFKSTKSVFKKSDVVYGKLRPYLDKVIVADEDGVCTTEMIPIKSFNNCNPEYLRLYLKSPRFIEYANGSTHGMRMPRMGIDVVKNALVPIPPLEEQKEIVNVVEILFKEVEQLEQLTVARIGLKEDFVTSALQQLTTNNAKQEWTFLQEHFKSFFNETTNIKKLRETVLQLAVQGKLTADWRENNPDTEDASILLKRIKAEKAQLIKDKKIKKEKGLPSIAKEEIPYELPEGWVWCRIIDVCERVTDGFHHTPTKLDKGIRYVSATHIKEEGVLWDNCHFIGEKEHLELFRKASQGKGDVLIVNRGAGCGTPAIVDIDEPFSFQNAALIGFNQLYINSHYMNNFILQKRTEIMDIFTNGGAQPMLSNKILKTLLFPFPPIKEQKAIVEKVNALMDLCDALDQEVQQSQEHSEKMMQSVLREVFEGEKADAI